jgi:hypothetical protein
MWIVEVWTIPFRFKATGAVSGVDVTHNIAAPYTLTINILLAPQIPHTWLLIIMSLYNSGCRMTCLKTIFCRFKLLTFRVAPPHERGTIRQRVHVLLGSISLFLLPSLLCWYHICLSICCPVFRTKHIYMAYCIMLLQGDAADHSCLDILGRCPVRISGKVNNNANMVTRGPSVTPGKWQDSTTFRSGLLPICNSNSVLSCNDIQNVTGGKVDILRGHSQQKMYMYKCPILNVFPDRAISLHNSIIVDKKEILRTVSKTGIYCSSYKVGTVCRG